MSRDRAAEATSGTEAFKGDAKAFERTWWLALAVFRWASLGYAALVLARTIDGYARPAGAGLALAGMTAWTLVANRLYRDSGRRGWPLLCVDLLVAVAAILSTGFLQSGTALASGAPTLPVIWVAAPVMAWALVHGWWAAIPPTALIGAAGAAVRGDVTASLLHNAVLLLFSGGLVGFMAALGRRAEAQLAQATAVQAAAAERDRLARVVHDGVLQVLGLTARPGSGVDPELARLAADQEAALRALVAGGPPSAPTPGPPHVDGAAAVAALAGRSVSVSGPLDPVLLPAHTSGELVAAVRATLDNVARHAGPQAHAYVLVEDLREHVEVTVRDDGPGFPDGRLAEAVAQGRLGVAQSIVGRVKALGGTATIDSTPGDGVRVVLRVPRSGVAA